MLLKIHVEGKTEQAFIKQILQPDLEILGYTVSAQINLTSQDSFGGLSHYEQFKTNTLRIKKNAPDCLLTTMIDLYGLPNDFPGMSESDNIENPYEKVTYLETELANDLNIENFIPYIQLHEFEALLFSDIEKIDQVLGRDQSSKLPQLQNILKNYPSPEKIDHNNGPSRRLQNIYYPKQRYAKITQGIEIARKIGLSVMRNNCYHFDKWIGKLEEYAETHR
ncbi:hypothetical protein McpSp1_11460 [Methanocorpusculaceae archaeon Sp1]|nr:hypothetical protein [Methanocorpusculaceae archaeon Sp1]